MKLEKILDIVHKPIPRIGQQELLEGISKIESLAGVTLPDDFCHFLTAYGWPFYTTPSLAIASLTEDQSFDFAVFYGIGGDAAYGVVRSMLCYQDRFPEKCIPIGNDYFGNIYLYDLSHGNEKVYFWMHDEEVDEKLEPRPYYSNMTLLANSFTEFLSRLTPEVYDDEESQ
jgi:hypothetical protein